MTLLKKFKCKRCDRKFKIHDVSEVKCDNANCEVIYNMHGQRLSFKDFKLTRDAPKFISEYTAPKPVALRKATELSVEEWEAYLESQGACGNVFPPF